jgi:putative DNA primase/helicase
MALPARGKHDDLTPEEIAALVAQAQELFRTDPQRVLDAALDYSKRGWSIIPIPLAGTDRNAGKRPLLKGWPQLRLTTPELVQQYFSPHAYLNVGLILGHNAAVPSSLGFVDPSLSSSSLVDIDHDCPEAIALAPHVLSATGAIFGRPDAPGSHRLYRCSGAVPSFKFSDPITGKVMVEIRGDGGYQTVLPPSIHVFSGTRIEWVTDGTPQNVAFPVLWQEVARVAIGALLMRYCPDAQFDRNALASDPRLVEAVKRWEEEYNKTFFGARDAKPAARAPAARALAAPRKPAPSTQETETTEEPAPPPPNRAERDRLWGALLRIGSRPRNEVWIPVGGALHDMYGWSEELARETWDKWSRDCLPENEKDVYDDAEQEKAWQSFKRENAPKRAGRNRIFELAREAGWKEESAPFPEELLALVPPVDESDDGLSPEKHAMIERLAHLSTAQYEEVRRAAAKKLGVRMSWLDPVVAARRASIYGSDDDDEDNLQGESVEIYEPEPCQEPVDTHDLIVEHMEFIRRYVHQPDKFALLNTLWTTHTFTYRKYLCTPRLAIVAPEPDCGKTTLLDTISYLSYRGGVTMSDSTPAFVFRAIQKYKLMYALDEADALFDPSVSSEMTLMLTRILNAGHKQTGRVGRCVGEQQDPRAFNVFAPMAIAYINRKDLKITPATKSRCLVSPLDRMPAYVKVAEFNENDLTAHQALQRKTMRWRNDHIERLSLDPMMPASIKTRNANNWKPLLAIADLDTRGDFANMIRGLAVAETQRLQASKMSDGALLLGDFLTIFNAGEHVAFSRTIQEKLNAMEDRSWARMGSLISPGISARKISDLLEPYGIEPKIVEIKGQRGRGYERKDFELVWARYLDDNDDASD